MQAMTGLSGLAVVAAGASSGGAPALDFGQAANSQYSPLFF
jgi:hypothetical protein